MFKTLIWQKDRMLMDDLVFRLQHHLSDDWELADRCFIFFKTQALVNQYQAFFSAHREFHPRNVFELGLWDGGSLAFWFENLRPAKQIGIDIQQRSNSQYLQNYIKDRKLADRLKVYWGIDQSDAQKIGAIVSHEFDGPLDLVIDDASHFYEPTKTSFECLFPLLKPGGFYLIEDWAWELWNEFKSPDHPMVNETGLTGLVAQLVKATGVSRSLIRSITIYRGFTAVERGDAVLNSSTFRLLDHITETA